MLRFWRNPEFVRYRRAELRPARAAMVATVVLVICLMIALSAWSAAREEAVNHAREINLHDFGKMLYTWLAVIQAGVLALWCLGACGQAISRERELKTYDFLKTTRLTAGELLVGKLTGAPVLAWVAIACSLPVSLGAALLARFPLSSIFLSHVLMLVFALFMGMVGLWFSMQAEKPGAGGVVLGLLGLWFLGAVAWEWMRSPFPGFAAISVLPALYELYDPAEISVTPTLFGAGTSFFFLSLLLYLSCGAWLALMIVRNLKRDIEEMRLLSRWQAVRFTVFLNLLCFAFLRHDILGGQGPRVYWASYWPPGDISLFMVCLNAVVLFFVGLATLSPHERLKIWWRKRAAGEAQYLSEDGLPWPWLVLSAAAAYAMLAANAMLLRGGVPLEKWELRVAGLQLLTVLVFTARDILFLQWCNLTRMKRPVAKGFLWLSLYYGVAGVVALVVSLISQSPGRVVLALLTPWSVFLPAGDRNWGAIFAGLAMQLPVVLVLVRLLTARLRRPATAAPAAAD